MAPLTPSPKAAKGGKTKTQKATSAGSTKAASTRGRACDQCRGKKEKCDMSQPTCGRCLKARGSKVRGGECLSEGLSADPRRLQKGVCTWNGVSLPAPAPLKRKAVQDSDNEEPDDQAPQEPKRAKTTSSAKSHARGGEPKKKQATAVGPKQAKGKVQVVSLQEVSGAGADRCPRHSSRSPRRSPTTRTSPRRLTARTSKRISSPN